MPPQPPEIPERVSSLLSTSRQNELMAHRQRSASALSRLSQMSSETTVGEFLEAKAASLQAELEFIKCQQAACGEVRESEKMTGADFVEVIQPYLANFRSASQELHITKRQRRTFHADLEDEYGTKRQRFDEPSNALLERAYQTVMVERIMFASAKQSRRKFSQSGFRKDVLAYYCPAACDGVAWCHILGRAHHKVKAAHIVPKILTGDELAHLFGDDESVFDDKRNGLTLHSALEQRLDQGIIVIVPLAGEISAPTRWKCVVLDDTKRNDIIYQSYEPQGKDPEIIRLGDLDGKELTFLTDNRPARRFLYLRFIISYLHAKRNGNVTVQNKVDRTQFWPTLGRYLNKSTLVSLARCVSGCKLPESLVEGQTFESEDSAVSEDAGLLLSMKLRDAWTDSAKKLSKQENTDEHEYQHEDEDEDEDEDDDADRMDEDEES